jgi:hypothetical protein
VKIIILSEHRNQGELSMGIFDQYLPGMPKELRNQLHRLVQEVGTVEEQSLTPSAWRMSKYDSRSIKVESTRDDDVVALSFENGEIRTLITPAIYTEAYALAKSSFYYLYAVAQGAEGLTLALSPNIPSVGPSGHSVYRHLGPIRVNNKGIIKTFTQDGNNFTFHSREWVPGTYTGVSGTVDLRPVLPATAIKATISVSIYTKEDKRATVRVYVSGEKEEFESVESPIGETVGEGEFTIAVVDEQIQYRIDRSRATNPRAIFQILGWVDRTLV